MTTDIFNPDTLPENALLLKNLYFAVAPGLDLFTGKSNAPLCNLKSLKIIGMCTDTQDQEREYAFENEATLPQLLIQQRTIRHSWQYRVQATHSNVTSLLERIYYSIPAVDLITDVNEIFVYELDPSRILRLQRAYDELKDEEEADTLMYDKHFRLSEGFYPITTYQVRSELVNKIAGNGIIGEIEVHKISMTESEYSVSGQNPGIYLPTQVDITVAINKAITD